MTAEISKAMGSIREHGLYPDVHHVSTAHAPVVTVDGREVHLFASNNYLGMLTDSRVKQAAIDGCNKWGIGNGSARLLTGNIELHEELEARIARFKGKEAALTFVSGYMVNEGCIPALANLLHADLRNGRPILRRSRKTTLFGDRLNHASLKAGIQMSGAECRVYNHNDMDDLERLLSQEPRQSRKIIVTDAVFSMEGDIVDFPTLSSLATEYGAQIYLDDAHGTGILGATGKGTEEHFGMQGRSEFVMGTFTKAFGGVGGYIVGSRDLADYLKVTAWSSVFTAPIAPPVAAGLVASIGIVEAEPWRRERLLDNAAYLRERLNEMGFDTLGSETQIVPVLIGDDMRAEEVSRKLFELGYFVPTARWPAVPMGTARLRLALMHEHTKEQIDGLLDALTSVDHHMGLRSA